MKLLMWVRFSLRELFGQKRFTLFLTLNLMLGLVGFVALETVKSSVESSLNENSKNILGADLNISGRRDFLDIEAKIVNESLGGFEHTVIKEVYSMVQAPQGTRLSQVRAMEDAFPFYGKFKLQNKAEATGKDLASGEVWVYPEFLSQIGVKIGDNVRIGEATFLVRDVVLDDIGALWASFSLAPRVYMKLADLQKTGLVRDGSLITYNNLYRIPKDEDVLADALSLKLKDPALKITTHRKASEQSARFLAYFNDYLALIAIVALVLSSIGSVFLIRGYLQSKIRELSILMSLGLEISKAQAVFVFQIFVLCLVASLGSFLAGPLLFKYLHTILASVFTLDVSYQISTQTTITLFVIGTIGNLLVFLPMFMRIRELSPSHLFQEVSGRNILTSKKDVLYALPSVVYFWALSVLQAHSIKNGSYFFLGMFASGALLYALGLGALKLLENIKVSSLGVSMSLRFLARNKQSTLSSFLALSLGAIILSLVPQIETSLKSEIQEPQASLVPSLFLFDIQDEQIEELKTIVQTQNKELSSLSPLVRARLQMINDVELEKPVASESQYFREDEQSQRSKNRAFNLSYRQKLSETEEIIDGRPFGTTFTGQGVPEISIEERFAESLGVKLGDKLTFDIQGVAVEGSIVNLRRVKWTSFQPNFFVQFQEGVLENAPKTFLAAITKLNQEERISLQNSISQKLSNVSIVDVSRILDKIMGIIRTISLVLSLMAALSLATGLVVLVSIVVYQVQSKFAEMTLLKVLGASPFQLQKLFVVESLIIGFGAGLLGALMGIGFSYALSKIIFDGVWVVDFKSIGYVILALTTLSGLSSYFGSLFVLRKEKAF